MAEVGTLDDFLGADPALADNSVSTINGQSPGYANAAGTGADAAFAELSNLRTLSERHRQQLNGARTEVQRMRQELEAKNQQLEAAQAAQAAQRALELQLAELKGMVQQQQTQQHPSYSLTPPTHPADIIPQTPPPRSAGGPPQEWVELQREVLGYDVPQEKLDQLWQAQMRASGVTQEQVMELLSRHDRHVNEQGMVGQMLQASYPELANAQDPFTLRTMELYTQMQNNPAYQRVFQQSVMVTDPGSGTQFNAGLVMQAANQARMEQLQGQQNHNRRVNAPTPGLPQGGGRPAPPQTNPNSVISKGMAELLSSPEFQQVAQRAGLGRDAREVWSTLGPRVSQSVRQGWAQEAQSRGISYTGT